MRAITIGLILATIGCSVERKPPHQESDSTVVVDSSEASLPVYHSSYGYRLQVAVDSSTYVIRYRLGTNFSTGDTVFVAMTRDSAIGIKPFKQTRTKFTKADSATFKVDKIYNLTANYTACIRTRRNTLKSEICQIWKTDYKKIIPVPDSIFVDSTLAFRRIDIRPNRVDSLHLGQTVQFCAFFVFKDGKVALRTKDKSNATCLQYSTAFTLAQRSIRSDQQAVADTACIRWRATGGTITTEACDTWSQS